MAFTNVCFQRLSFYSISWVYGVYRDKVSDKVSNWVDTLPSPSAHLPLHSLPSTGSLTLSHDRFRHRNLVGRGPRVPRTPACWLILETNHTAVIANTPGSPSAATWSHARSPNFARCAPGSPTERIRQWLDHSPQGRLFIEPDFERAAALQPALRKPFSARPLLASPHPAPALGNRFGGRFPRTGTSHRRVGDPSPSMPRRPRPFPFSDPLVFREPPNFLYDAELLHRLAPWFPVWGELLTALASLSVHHAYLRGRNETTEEDWKILSRVAADSVPWIRRVIHHLDQENSAPAAGSAPARPSVH